MFLCLDSTLMIRSGQRLAIKRERSKRNGIVFLLSGISDIWSATICRTHPSSLTLLEPQEAIDSIKILWWCPPSVRYELSQRFQHVRFTRLSNQYLKNCIVPEGMTNFVAIQPCTNTGTGSVLSIYIHIYIYNNWLVLSVLYQYGLVYTRPWNDTSIHTSI